MLEMSTEIIAEWFSRDLLLFCNHFVNNAASSEEMSSVQTDAGSFALLLSWLSFLTMLPAVLCHLVLELGVVSCKKKNTPKYDTSSMLKWQKGYFHMVSLAKGGNYFKYGWLFHPHLSYYVCITVNGACIV